MARASSELVPVTFYLDPRQVALLGLTDSTKVAKVVKRRGRRPFTAPADAEVVSFTDELRKIALKRKIITSDTSDLKVLSRLGHNLEKIGVRSMEALKNVDADEISDQKGFGVGQARLLRQIQKTVEISPAPSM